jgi:hypothetical protein
MDHIGIDLGGKDSQVCVRNDAGAIIEEARHPTTGLGSWLARRAPARVVVETCTEAFPANSRLGQPVEVTTVEPPCARSRAGYSWPLHSRFGGHLSSGEYGDSNDGKFHRSFRVSLGGSNRYRDDVTDADRVAGYQPAAPEQNS